MYIHYICFVSHDILYMRSCEWSAQGCSISHRAATGSAEIWKLQRDTSERTLTSGGQCVELHQAHHLLFGFPICSSHFEETGLIAKPAASICIISLIVHSSVSQDKECRLDPLLHCLHHSNCVFQCVFKCIELLENAFVHAYWPWNHSQLRKWRRRDKMLFLFSKGYTWLLPVPLWRQDETTNGTCR